MKMTNVKNYNICNEKSIVMKRQICEFKSFVYFLSVLSFLSYLKNAPGNGQLGYMLEFPM